MTCIAELDSTFIFFPSDSFFIFESFPSVWVVPDGDRCSRGSTSQVVCRSGGIK